MFESCCSYEVYEMLHRMGIKSWRPINVELIGRACVSHDLMLKLEQFGQLIFFYQRKAL